MNHRSKIAGVFLATAISLVFLCACQAGRGTTSTEEFEKACSSDGLTVTSQADSSALPFSSDLESYSTAGLESSSQVLVQHMVFKDQEAAKAAYDSLTQEADPGKMGSIYQNVLRNYTVTVAQMDSSYTKLILSGSQVLIATGPTMYKSQLDRTLLKFGYQ